MSILRDVIFDAVDRVNDKFIHNGFTPDLERYFPLLEIHTEGIIFRIYFFGQCVWDTDNDPMPDDEYSPEYVERVLCKRIADVRKAMIISTSAINPMGI